MQGRGDFALDRRKALLARFEPRHVGEERLRVGMIGRGIKLFGRRDLDDACVRAGLPLFGDERIADLARRALDGLPRAQIGTLHSFAASLVKAHAFELGLSPGFELADEDDRRARVDTVINDSEAPYRSMGRCPVSCSIRSNTGTGSAALPDTNSRAGRSASAAA